VERVMSQKNATAPTLAEAARAGLLPRYEACLEYAASRAGRWAAGRSRARLGASGQAAATARSPWCSRSRQPGIGSMPALAQVPCPSTL